MSYSRFAAGLLAALACAAQVQADPFSNLFRSKKSQVAADPAQSYVLSEQNGPWMILAATFRDAEAEQHAHDLVIELRSRYKLNAYVHNRTFDYTGTEEGLGFNRFGDKKTMTYANKQKVQEFAVLIGDFPAVDDPRAQKTLALVKNSSPNCLNEHVKEAQSDEETDIDGLTRFRSRLLQVGDTKLNDKYKFFNLKGNKGLMASAFMVPNPRLPPEYFHRPGMDKIVYEMNKDAPHSLLRCPGRYTVVVATFKGSSTVDQRVASEATPRNRSEDDKLTRLELAAVDAQRLCEFLVTNGEQAYVFHDRTASMVCVGSFNEIGVRAGNGRMMYHPAVDRVMKTFGAAQPPGTPAAAGGLVEAKVSRPGFHSYSEFGVPKSVKVGNKTYVYDLEPLPVEAPRYSVGLAYEREPVRR